MKRILIIIAILFIAVATANAITTVGTVTQKVSRINNMAVLEISWVSAGDAGDIQFTTKEISGSIVGFLTDPDATNPPLDNYDIVIITQDGYKLCGDTGSGETPTGDGLLGNRDTANTEYKAFTISGETDHSEFPIQGSLDIYIGAAGETTGETSYAGKLKIFYK